MRAIGVSHTACKDEFRRNLRSHSWSVFSFFFITGEGKAGFEGRGGCISSLQAVCDTPIIYIYIMIHCSGVSGVLVNLTACKRLTDSLPKLRLITLSAPETAEYQVGRIYIRADLSISKRFHFLGIPGRLFFKFDTGQV